MAIKYQHLQKGRDVNIVAANGVPQAEKHGTPWTQKFSRKQAIGVLAAVVTLILINPAGCEDIDGQTSSDLDENLVDANEPLTKSPGKLWIVSRKEWLAAPPKADLTPLEQPVPYVIIMHTATENCSNQAECTFHVQDMQKFHVGSRGWDDIGYSFLVGGDGNAYEGRGWNSVGAQVYGYNAKCIGITFIGTFNNYMPPERQIVAAKQLIEIGVEKGYIAKDYKLLAARQLQTTQSPGLLLYEDIKKWPHWSEKP